ncbi:MAG: DHHW family protein [Lachnospiraceae bacterium]|nr:DHHW family protein [Lachnospiraceae bacterium]
MKKWKNNLWRILFIILFLLPNIAWLFYGTDTESSENRALADFPTLSLETYREYPRRFEDWLDDHLPFKESMVSSLNTMTYRLFKESEVDKVIPGKDGWLFYDGAVNDDGDTVGEYKRTVTVSQEELESIKENLVYLNESLDKKGIRLILMIPSNKEEIYSEYMPDFIKVMDGQSKCDILVDYLSKNAEIEVIYPKEKMLQYKEQYPLYYKTDTHWTLLGAYVAYGQLEDSLHEGIKELSYVSVKEISLKEAGCSSDLAKMLNMKSYGENEKGYALEQYPFADSSDGSRINKSAKYEERIAFVGDSFRTAMMPYIRGDYQYSYFIHRNKFSEAEFEEFAPDVVVLEFAERYIDEMANWKFYSDDE